VICVVGVDRPLVEVVLVDPYVVADAVVEFLGVEKSPNCDEDEEEEESDCRAPVRAVWRVNEAEVDELLNSDGTPTLGGGETGYMDDGVVRRADCGRPSDAVEYDSELAEGVDNVSCRRAFWLPPEHVEWDGPIITVS